MSKQEELLTLQELAAVLRSDQTQAEPTQADPTQAWIGSRIG